MIKHTIRKIGGLVFGKTPKIHRIRFGPLKGRKIFIRFDYSPRMYFGIGEPWIAKLVKEHVSSENTVYDIGAHIGYTCLLFRNRIGDNGSIHAFEILPSIANNYLRKTIIANNLTNVVIHNKGLARSSQSLQLSAGATGMGSIYNTSKNSEDFENCTTVPLDEYVILQDLPKPNLIKIDIEGAEIECLEGGKNLIESCRPKMIIEFHSLELLIKGLEFLEPLGYTLHLQSGEILTSKVISKLKHFHQSTLCLQD